VSDVRTGKAIGGPIDGREISSDSETVKVPIRTGPDRGEGDRGYGAAVYRWFGDRWLYVTD